MKITHLITIVTLLVFLGCSDHNNNNQISGNTHTLNLLKIIPTDPSYIPTKAGQDRAKNLLTKLYNVDQIKLSTSKEIEFVDQGETFDSVLCNLCGSQIPIETWQTAMEKSNEQQFKNLSFRTPCCDKNVSLNDLTYKAAAGFSKFIIIITDAQNDINQTNLTELEHDLGIHLRVIWARY